MALILLFSCSLTAAVAGPTASSDPQHRLAGIEAKLKRLDAVESRLARNFQRYLWSSTGDMGPFFRYGTLLQDSIPAKRRKLQEARAALLTERENGASPAPCSTCFGDLTPSENGTPSPPS
jgi:hypothetical protein